MPTGTVRIHRVLSCPPEKVFRAFTTPDAMARWLPPFGFTCKVHHMDVREGGTFRMSFTNFTTMESNAFGGEYLEIIPNERLRYSNSFEDPNLPGTLEVTVTLRPVLCGTELFIQQTGIPEVIPVEMCYLGWQESLEMLARLVVPDIRQ